MEASKSELLIIIELINDFYQEIRIGCTSRDDLVEKGKQWIKEVKDKYNSKAIYSAVQDVLLQNIFKYNGESANPYNALIMKGGGIKGIAYVGALEELLKFYTFNWFAGTSAGAITAILLGAGFSIEELRDILGKKNFKDFKDANILKALYNLITKSGLYEAHMFNVWLEELLAQKLRSAVSVQMRDLPYRTTVFASRKDRSIQVFDSNNSDSQQHVATFAARCSMSIPYIFTPQKIDGRNILDGGMKYNFPLELILKDNKDMNFVGLYFGAKTYKHEKNSVLFDSLKIWTESNDAEILRDFRDKLIIIDPTPISTLKFKLSDVEKDFLLESGRLAALEFLDNNQFLKKEDHNYIDRLNNIEDVRRKLIKKKKIRSKSIKMIILLVVFLTIYFFTF